LPTTCWSTRAPSSTTSRSLLWFRPGAIEDMHRGVCAVDSGSTLKFIDVVASSKRLGAASDTFTISTYTLTTTEAGRIGWEKDAVAPMTAEELTTTEAGRIGWEKDAVAPMTAEELWGLEAPSPVPHEVPLFPSRAWTDLRSSTSSCQSAPITSTR